MNLSRTYKTIIYSISLLFLMSSCSKEDITETFDTSLVNVKIKGTPSLFSKVNIEVLDVQFRVLEDETNPYAWVSLNTINSGVHDLTRLTQEHAMSLVDFEEVSSGYIYSIKIVLGDQNTVMENGVEHVLDISSEFQSASENVIEKQLDPNMLYEFVVEFEIDESVLFTSDGNFNFNPKINTLMRRFQLN